MMYLVLDLQSTQHTSNCKQLNAWVNVRNHTEAMGVLSEELGQLGWVVLNVVESSITDESDYFPPCEGLDALNEARKNLLALRFW